MRTPEVDPLSQLLNLNIVSLQVVLESLYQAAKDRRVIGLVAKLGQTKATHTQWQEIRDALKHFRASGKKAICFSEAFAEYGSGTALYWVASAFDEIYTTPYSTLHLLALRMDMPFVKGTLEKLDVEPHAVRRSEYKTALEQFTEDKFTEPARANWSSVIEVFYNQFAADIAEYLKKTPEEVKKIIEEGPYSAETAKQMGLITDTVYLGDFMDTVVPEAFGRPDVKRTNLLFFKNYYKVRK
jgi:protease IV